LSEQEFDKLTREGQVDAILLAHAIRYELVLLERESVQWREMLPLVETVLPLFELLESHRRHEPLSPRRSAEELDHFTTRLTNDRNSLEAATSSKRDESAPKLSVSPSAALRAAGVMENLRRELASWHRFGSGYDPTFTWWTAAPAKKADAAIAEHARFLRSQFAKVPENDRGSTIVGDPIGETGLKADLDLEMIPYSIPRLIEIAEEEFAWCDKEAKKAAANLGCGDDWLAALAKVKDRYLEPGEQPGLIRDLNREAIAFIESRQLLSVPPLAQEIWRMEMMSPEAQKVNPYFLGGEQIIVSFPTDGMEHSDKLMSMRSNNRSFARATVFHELIPGHHLQGFMSRRYNPHRAQVFSTPFWTEGWALYWEMRLWDLGFPRDSEDKVGMLFWRMHRCARIIFSLKFHLKQMTPAEAIEFLVARVGHERSAAEAEVRRSFNGSYPPLYQAAYMLGGLQFRALHRELVATGKMSEREFHDRVLRAGNMPVEMIRALLMPELPLAASHQASWRFANKPATDQVDAGTGGQTATPISAPR
jgi:hypothetical protein